MATTIKEVAQLAGVSQSTASRALTGTGYVEATTAEAVRRAAQELNYRPNRWAAHLRGAPTRRIGLVVPDLMNPFFADLVKGAQARARELGYSVFVADTDDDPSLEQDVVQSLAQHSDGILLATPRMSQTQLDSLSLSIPLVLLYRTSERFPSVIGDVEYGLRQALDNLIALGHTRIGYVDGPPESWSAGLRRRVLADQVLTDGVSVTVLGQVSARFEGGVAAGDLVLASGVTAVLAFNDIVAFGLLHRLAERGVRVPADISIVGFDGIPAAAMVTPTLTTVAQPLTSSARVAVDMVIHLSKGVEPAERTVILTPSLVVRDSTGVSA